MDRWDQAVNRSLSAPVVDRWQKAVDRNIEQQNLESFRPEGIDFPEEGNTTVAESDNTDLWQPSEPSMMLRQNTEPRMESALGNAEPTAQPRPDDGIPWYKRASKQFANSLIPSAVKYFMASGKMLEQASTQDPELKAIYDKLGRRESLTDAEKVTKAEKEQKLLAGFQYTEGAVEQFRPESLKVQPPQNIGEKISDVGTGLAAFMTHLLVSKKLVPPGTVISPKLANAMAFEIAGRAEGQQGGEGLVLGSVLNQTARIPSTVSRLAVESGIFGGLTAAEGGNWEDVLISAGVPVALQGVHSAMSWAGFAKQYPGFAMQVSKRVQTDRDMSHEQARNEALSAAKAYKANPDDPAAQAEWRRVTAKYGGYGSLKTEGPEPLTPAQQTRVKDTLAELQAQVEAERPPVELTPEQRAKVTADLAELNAKAEAAKPEGVLKTTLKGQQFPGVKSAEEQGIQPERGGREPFVPPTIPQDQRSPVGPVKSIPPANAVANPDNRRASEMTLSEFTDYAQKQIAEIEQLIQEGKGTSSYKSALASWQKVLEDPRAAHLEALKGALRVKAPDVPIEEYFPPSVLAEYPELQKPEAETKGIETADFTMKVPSVGGNIDVPYTVINRTPEIPEGHKVVLQETKIIGGHAYRISVVEKPGGETYSWVEMNEDQGGSYGGVKTRFVRLNDNELEKRKYDSVNKVATKLWNKYESGKQLPPQPKGTPNGQEEAPQALQVTQTGSEKAPSSESPQPVPVTQKTPADAIPPKPAEPTPPEPPKPPEVAQNKEPEPTKTTSARQADIAEDRKAMGLESMNSKEKESFRKWKDQAEKEGIPEKALQIATEINAKPRPLTDVETAGITVRMAQLKRQFGAAMEKIKSSTDDAEKSTLQAEADRIESEFDIISKAVDTSGTEKGRALVSQKLTLDENYELISILNRAKTNKGKPLSDSERATLVDLTAKIDKANADIEALQKQVNDLSAKGALREGGLKRYKGMTEFAKKSELDGLVSRARDLLKAGCY